MARLNHVKSFRGTTKTESGNLTCGRCHTAIEPGMPYQWWANRAPGQRGSFRNIRCMNCTPTVAERTPGRRGQWLQMEQDFEQRICDISAFEDLENVAGEIAGEIRDFANEFIESADNMESGFGHETSTSAELRERGEEIESAADGLEQLSFDEPEEAEEFDEDAVGEELAQAMFACSVEDLDDEDRDADDKIDWQAKLQERRDEHDDIAEANNEALENALEAGRDEIRDALGEVCV